MESQISLYWEPFYKYDKDKNVKNPTAHIHRIGDYELCVTPGGNETGIIKAMCGSEIETWVNPFVTWNDNKTLEQVIEAKIRICEGCLKIYNEHADTPITNSHLEEKCQKQ